MRLPVTLGEYRLVEQLGVGAFGNVYRAEVLGDLGFSNQVAIKLLDPLRVSDVPAVVSAFADEAGFLSKMSHPNIINVLQFKEISHEFLGNTFLMATELVRGQTLRDLLMRLRDAGTRMPLEAVVLLLCEAVDALRYAHGLKTPSGAPLGLVHRDLKPENLMVSENGYLKILDFGIAWAGERLSGQTMTQMTKGTPLYMSPEQLRGMKLDGRSDLFSVGAIAFEMVCLERYVPEPETGSLDLAALVHASATVTWEARYPVVHDVLRSRQGYGLDDVAARSLENLMGWLLSPRPDDRPANAHTLLGPLEALQDTWKPSVGRRFFRHSVGEWSTADEVPAIDFPLRTPPTHPTSSMPVSDEEQVLAIQDPHSVEELLSDDLVPASGDSLPDARAVLEGRATVASMPSSGGPRQPPPGGQPPEMPAADAEQLFDGFDSQASLAPMAVSDAPLPESAPMPVGPTRQMPAHSGMDPPGPTRAFAPSDRPEGTADPEDVTEPGLRLPRKPGEDARSGRVTGGWRSVADKVKVGRKKASRRTFLLVVGGLVGGLVGMILVAGVLVTLITRTLGGGARGPDPVAVQQSASGGAGQPAPGAVPPPDLLVEDAPEAEGAAPDENARSGATAGAEDPEASVATEPAAAPASAPAPAPAPAPRAASTRSGRTTPRKTSTRKRTPRKRTSSGRQATPKSAAKKPKRVASPGGGVAKSGGVWGNDTSGSEPGALQPPLPGRRSTARARPPLKKPPTVSAFSAPPYVAPGGTYTFDMVIEGGEAGCTPKLWLSPSRGGHFDPKNWRPWGKGRYERLLSLSGGAQWSNGLYYYVTCCWQESGPCPVIKHSRSAPGFIPAPPRF